MPVKQSARTQVIRDEVNRQVNDVNAIIKDLLAKKISEMKAQNPEGQQIEQKKTADYGQLYNSVVEALESLKVEITTSPSTETVRQLRIMLNDIVKNFKGLPTSSVKAILDLLFNFIPYVRINKPPISNYNSNEKNFNKPNSKSSEIRRLIRDTLIKFVHENSIKYLHADIYPKSYEEAKKYFNIENLSKDMVKTENDSRQSRLDKREKEDALNEAQKAANAREQAIEEARMERKKNDDIDKNQAFSDLYNFLRDPAQYSLLFNIFVRGSTVFNELRRVGENTAQLESYHPDEVYTNSLVSDMKKTMTDIPLSQASDAVSSLINLYPLVRRKAIAKYIRDNINYPPRIFNKMVGDFTPPTDLEQLLNLVKVRSNFNELLPKINIT